MATQQSELPAYPADNKSLPIEEKKEQQCTHTPPTQTPYLDAQLRKPNTRAALLALSAAFAAAAEGENNRCLKCAVESVRPELGLCVQEMKVAKKNGDFSKEEKKALKREMKWVLGDLKKGWKE